MIKLIIVIEYNIINKLALSQNKKQMFEKNSYFKISNIGHNNYNLKTLLKSPNKTLYDLNFAPLKIYESFINKE